MMAANVISDPNSTRTKTFKNTLNLCQVQGMDDNCGEWVECMGVGSGSGWNLWVWLAGGRCRWNLWVVRL